jgi:hypothetical protein
MPIDLSVENGVFVPEAAAVIGEVFEVAYKELNPSRSGVVRELIAARIIGAARSSELRLITPHQNVARSLRISSAFCQPDTFDPVGDRLAGNP